MRGRSGAYADTNADGNANTNTDADGNANTTTYTDANTNTDANFDAGGNLRPGVNDNGRFSRIYEWLPGDDCGAWFRNS